jgi:Tol biopolymer transport system component
MKKIAPYLLALLPFFFLACDEGDGGTEPVVPVPTTLVIAPGDTTLTALSMAVRLSATIRDQDGDVMTGELVGWESLDAEVASIDEDGEVLALAPGKARIVARSAGLADTSLVKVSQIPFRIKVEPESHLFTAIHDSLQFHATVYDANDHLIEEPDFFFWSTIPEVATVYNEGMVMAWSEGTTHIVATYQHEVSDSVLVEVRISGDGPGGDGPGDSDGDESPVLKIPAAISIRPDTIRFNAIGYRELLTPVLTDEDGRVLGEAEVDWENIPGHSIVWSSSDRSIASAGLVDGPSDPRGMRPSTMSHDNGVAMVYARLGSLRDSATVVVQQVPASWGPKPAPAVLGEGDTLRLGIVVSDSNRIWIQSELDKGVWSIHDPGVATLTPSGHLTAHARGGETWATVTYGGESQNVQVRVMDQIAFIGGNTIYLVQENGERLGSVPNTNLDTVWVPETPAWGPGGGSLLFTYLNGPGSSLRDTIRPLPYTDIHSWTIGDADAVNVTRRSGFDAYPSWAPKGDRFAFASDRGVAGNEDIFITDTQGAVVEQVTNLVMPATYPAWAPYGSWIAFHSETGNGPGHHRITPDGAGHAALVMPVTRWTRPAWSPNNQKILYIQDGDTLGAVHDIWVMNEDATNPARLTSGPGSDLNPSWSPDGNRIVFQSNRDGKFGIYVMNADGGRLVKVTDSSIEAFEPSWSPDSRRIVFAGISATGVRQLYIIAAIGAAAVPIPLEGGSLSAANVPVWRPRPQ